MIVLRDYQREFRDAVFDRWREGFQTVIGVSPTGSGKRYTALDLCRIAHEKGRKVLFVGNRRLLVTQAAEDAQEHGVPFGVIMADYMEGDPGSSNQLASVQTLESWYFYDPITNEPTGTGLPPADLVIIDEAHQDTDRYRQLLAFYPDAKVLALTATPVGAEGRPLVPDPYQTLVETITNSALIRKGVLLPTTVFAPSEPDIEGVKVVKRQEYNQKKLGQKVSECTVFADVFKTWEKFSDRATVCFVPGVKYGRFLVQEFNERLGPGQAYLIEAKTKHQQRQEIFAKVEAGKARVLVSVDVLKEGFDLPILSCGIDLQPNSQLRTYWQKLGRVKRAYQGQVEAVWLDFAGNYWKFPHPNQDPEWPKEDEETTQDVIQKSRKAGTASQPIMCPKCGHVRERGPICTNCGFKHEETIRRIRMGGGQLKEIPAHAKEKVEKTAEHRLLDKWKSRLIAGMRSNLTFGQCAYIFKKETGEHPRDGWPGTYDTGSLSWKKRVNHNLTMRELMSACTDITRGWR